MIQRASPQPYSISRLRTFYSGCSYKFHLKYHLGYKEKISSAAFLGKIAHAMIQQAYHGIALSEAHHRVWKQACNDIIQELQIWYTLDVAYHESGKPRTKARQIWAEQHPQYEELTGEIEAYKLEFLCEDYTWAKSAQLTNYYRWSAELAQVKLERLLLTLPVLVEGLPVCRKATECKCFQSDTQDSYHLLCGTIGDYEVRGVPDVFAVDHGGVAWVADYKTMNRPMTAATLSEDEQLALYVELLRQNGYITGGAPVRVGHIYLTDHIAEEDGVQPIWTVPSPHTLPRLAKQLTYMDQHIRNNDFIPIRGIATGTQSPCMSCGLARVCSISLANDALVPQYKGEIL